MRLGRQKVQTRSGETTKLVDLLDEAVDGAMKEHCAQGGIKGRGRAARQRREHVDEEMKNAAAVLGYGAVKYADLKSNRISNYIFSYERMLDPRGNTAVYLLYAGARIASILRTAEQDKGVDFNALLASGVTVQLVEPAELALGRGILRFQEVVERPSPRCFPTCATTVRALQPLHQVLPGARLGSSRTLAASSSTPPSPPSASRSSPASASSSASDGVCGQNSNHTSRSPNSLSSARNSLSEGTPWPPARTCSLPAEKRGDGARRLERHERVALAHHVERRQRAHRVVA